MTTSESKISSLFASKTPKYELEKDSEYQNVSQTREKSLPQEMKVWFKNRKRDSSLVTAYGSRLALAIDQDTLATFMSRVRLRSDSWIMHYWSRVGCSSFRYAHVVHVSSSIPLLRPLALVWRRRVHVGLRIPKHRVELLRHLYRSRNKDFEKVQKYYYKKFEYTKT